MSATPSSRDSYAVMSFTGGSSSPAEKPIYFAAVAISLLNIPAIIYALWNRKYLPIKVKNVWITAVIGFGCCIFNISYGAVSGMAGYEGIFSHCKLWSAWMMLALGLGIMLPAMVLRLVFYYRVFILKTGAAGPGSVLAKHIKMYWPFYILWLPLLCVCIVAEILPDKHTIFKINIQGADVCMMASPLSYFIISYYCFMALLACGMYIRMRSVAKVFNEFKLGLWIVATFLINCAFDLTIVFMGGSKYPWGRIVPTILYLLTYNGYFWLIIGPPIFNHMFRREAALREIIDTMHKDGFLAQQGQLGNVRRNLYGLNTTSSATKMSTPIHSKTPFEQTTRLESMRGENFPYERMETSNHTDTSLNPPESLYSKTNRYII